MSDWYCWLSMNYIESLFWEWETICFRWKLDSRSTSITQFTMKTNERNIITTVLSESHTFVCAYLHWDNGIRLCKCKGIEYRLFLLPQMDAHKFGCTHEGGSGTGLHQSWLGVGGTEKTVPHPAPLIKPRVFDLEVRHSTTELELPPLTPPPPTQTHTVTHIVHTRLAFLFSTVYFFSGGIL